MATVKPAPTEPGVLDARSDQFYAAVLGALQAPATEANLDVLRAWQAGEASTARWNPWNTTRDSGAPGQTDYNAFGTGGRYHVRNYPTADVGLSATVATLQAQAYTGIVDGLRAADPARAINGIVNSPWDGGYGAKGKRGARDYRQSNIWANFQKFAQTSGSVVPRLPAGVKVPAGYKPAGYTPDGQTEDAGFRLPGLPGVPSWLSTLGGTLTTGAFWARVGLIAGGLGLLIVFLVFIGKDTVARVAGSQVTGLVKGAVGKLGKGSANG